MKYLVTGSSGHLGEALVRVLRARSADVVGIDLRPGAFTQCTGSIADRDFVTTHMAGVNVVLHAATLHKPHVATHSRQEFIDTNISGTLNLLESARSEDVSAFVFTSTTSAFGDALTPRPGEPAAWITENVTPRSKNIYGATKLAAEDLCRLAHRKDKLPMPQESFAATSLFMTSSRNADGTCIQPSTGCTSTGWRATSSAGGRSTISRPCSITFVPAARR
jgi:UDP-glucose 4-epimerase